METMYKRPRPYLRKGRKGSFKKVQKISIRPTAPFAGTCVALLSAVATSGPVALAEEMQSRSGFVQDGSAITSSTEMTETSTSELPETSASSSVAETGSADFVGVAAQSNAPAAATSTSETPDISNSEINKTSASSSAAEVKPAALGSVTTRSTSPAAFIQAIASEAQKVASENDLYASVMIAQACLESGWGSSTLAQAPNYNLFGIKGTYNGQSVTLRTAEQDASGNTYYVNAKFRKYPSYVEAFYDSARVMKATSFQSGVYYYAGAWKSNAASAQAAANYLTGRYATDVRYGAKLVAIINTYQLTQYDSGTAADTGSSESTSTGSGEDQSSQVGDNTVNENEAGTKYTIVSGDTLYSIAKRYGTTVDSLKSWNGLSADLIYTGQSLLIKEATSDSAPSGSKGDGGNTVVSGKTYTVVSGDTLWRIAQKVKVSVATLKSLNNLKSDDIYIGQKLVYQKTNTSSSATTSSQNTYTVVSGDTLTKIAAKYKTTVNQLKSWNNLKSDRINTGQKLIIKKLAATSVATDWQKYTVKEGDTLYSIAKKYGVSVQNIQSWNNLKSDVITLGKTLQIQKKAETTAKSDSYVVKSGDTLYGIAKRYQLSVSQLQGLNQLSGSMIYVGQKLAVK